MSSATSWPAPLVSPPGGEGDAPRETDLAEQLSLLDSLTAFDRWAADNKVPMLMIERRFREKAEAGQRISVRDLWSWAREEFWNQTRPDGKGYAFNNDFTPELSRMLCEKYSHLNPRVYLRSSSKGVVAPHE
ncbi:MAG: hypothetical protein FWD65_04365 [Coriobacteriia bacterium]|nr:hypothetical protein [Coriobacteriia bacterium]